MIRTHSQKNLFRLHTVILNYFIYSRVKASQIHLIYGGTIAVTPNQNSVKAIYTDLMRRNFLSFKLFTTETQEKLCLPNLFTIFHIIGKMRSPTAFVRQWTSIDYCKTSDFFFWLIFLVSSLTSLATMKFLYS